MSRPWNDHDRFRLKTFSQGGFRAQVLSTRLDEETTVHEVWLNGRQIVHVVAKGRSIDWQGARIAKCKARL